MVQYIQLAILCCIVDIAIGYDLSRYVLGATYRPGYCPEEHGLLRVTKSAFSFCVHAIGTERDFWTTYHAREPHLFAAFDRYIGPSTIVLDLGGWIGFTPLYVAKLAKFVVTLEPSTVAYRKLAYNAFVNRDIRNRIVQVNAALGSFDGHTYFTDSGSSMDRPVVILLLENMKTLDRLSSPNHPFRTYIDSCVIDSQVVLSKHVVSDMLGLSDYVRNVALASSPGDTRSVVVKVRGMDCCVLLVDPRAKGCAELLSALNSKQPDRSSPDIRFMTLHDNVIEASDVQPDLEGTWKGISKVNVTSVSRLVQMYPGLASVGFIKIDVEGAEVDLVGELKELFLTARPVAVISLHRMYIGGDAVHEVLQQLAGIFPYLMELNGLTPFNRSRLRSSEKILSEDVLCLWTLKGGRAHVRQVS